MNNLNGTNTLSSQNQNLMTKKELCEKLEIVAQMGDKQIETIANILIDYYSTKSKSIGFKVKK